MEDSDFGHYRLERLLGSGGMGDVYRAFDSRRERVVALKLLPELFSGSAEFQHRFRRESRVAARLRDPHIIPIHDFGEIDRRLYIDMRLVDDGQSLATLLRDEGPLTPERAVHIVGQVAEGLDAAHADGLIHRDVKPSNVLVTARDFIYVIDFGIAHAVGHTASGLTMSGATVGTLDYMAPERFGSGPVDRRADVYALACVLHQCLTNRLPFTGADLPQLMFAHLYDDPPRASVIDPRIPAELDDVVATGLAKNPDDRYPTTGDLAEAARRTIGGAAPTSERTRREPSHSGARTTVPPQSPATTGPAPDPAASAPVAPASPPPSTSPPPAPTAPAPGRDTGTGAGDGPAPAVPPEPGPPAGPTPPHTPAPAPAAGLGPGERRGVVLVAVAAAVALAVLFGTLAMNRSGPTAPAPGAPPAASAPSLTSVAQPQITGAITTPATPGFAEVAPGGRSAYVTNRDPRLVSVVDLTTNQVTAQIPSPAAPPRFVAFNADGSRAYVAAYTDDDRTNQVLVVDTSRSAVVATVPLGKRPYRLAVAPDQRSLWVPSHDTGSIEIVDLASNRVVRSVPVAPNPHWVTFRGDRAYVANHESSMLTVLDVRTFRTITVVGVGASPHSVAISPDGTRAAVANYDADSVSLVDTTTYRVVGTVPVGRKPQFVGYSTDGRHLYTADVGGGTVSVVDTATGTVSATVPVGRSPTSVAVDPQDGRAFVTTLDDARLVVLSVAR